MWCFELLLHRRPDVFIDHVEGMEEDEDTIPQKRDPDALPPSNFLERISDLVYQVGRAVFNGNMLYAIKAGLLTGASCPLCFVMTLNSYASVTLLPVFLQKLCRVCVQ